MHCAQKCILQLFFRLSLVLNLFLSFHQISPSFSYEIVLTKKIVVHSAILICKGNPHCCLAHCSTRSSPAIEFLQWLSVSSNAESCTLDAVQCSSNLFNLESNLSMCNYRKRIFLIRVQCILGPGQTTRFFTRFFTRQKIEEKIEPFGHLVE